MSGDKSICVHTPSRKNGIKRIARRNYVSMASSVVNSPMAKSILSKLALKSEVKLSSDRHVSILCDSMEAAVQHFHWETVWIELQQKGGGWGQCYKVESVGLCTSSRTSSKGPTFPRIRRIT